MFLRLLRVSGTLPTRCLRFVVTQKHVRAEALKNRPRDNVIRFLLMFDRCCSICGWVSRQKILVKRLIGC